MIFDFCLLSTLWGLAVVEDRVLRLINITSPTLRIQERETIDQNTLIDQND